MQYRNSAYPADLFGAYWFEKNLQGDIVAVYDGSGKKLISYTYDAWGNFTTTYHNGCTASSHANLNPFRYRGYYYDNELEMYYLQSRYYDPVIGRFINADGIGYLGADGTVLSYNLFAYCGNNAPNACDPCGTCLHRWDFWNDCDSCGGRKINDKWNDFSNWCTNTYGEIKNFVTNDDIITTKLNLQKYGFSFYKGVPVIITNILPEAACSCGLIILGSDYKYGDYYLFEDTLKHEYGHALHFQQIGIGTYSITIALPSVIGALCNVQPYYNQPWERIANQLGECDGDYPPEVNTWASIYWILTLFL